MPVEKLIFKKYIQDPLHEVAEKNDGISNKNKLSMAKSLKKNLLK